MLELKTSSAHDISILSFLIESERFEGKRFEIAANIAEINIFEHIDLPYLTATALIIDSSNIFNMVNFQGTEKVKIKLRIFGDAAAQEVEKNFIVTDIDTVAPGGDTMEGLSLRLIEDHAYLDRLKVVSKAYSGKPEDIIVKLLKDNLDKDVSIKNTPLNTPIHPMKVVVPSWSTLDAVRWIKDRTLNANGLPFFVYSTLNDDELVMTDLEEMLTAPPINPIRDYVYSQAFTRKATETGVVDQSYIIQSYHLSRSEDMFTLINNGTINSTYNFIDTKIATPQSKREIRVNMQYVLEWLKAKNIIDPEQDGKIYDDKFELGGKTLAEHTPSIYTQIVTSNTFENYMNYYESTDLSQQRIKAIARALRYYLLKSPIDVVLPGFNFLGRGENATIGRQIRMKFMKNDQTIPDGEKTGDVIDIKRSGNYLIYSTRHIIRPERYDVSMSCVKLANLRDA